MTPRLDEIREWLQKAKNDLLSAQILMKHDPPVLDTASFHCQQAVEKALKAFLVWKGVSFDKVHSLAYFLDLCEFQEPEFSAFRERAEALAPYAIEIRYPGAVVEISQGEAEEALSTAEVLWEFFINLLPRETHV